MAPVRKPAYKLEKGDVIFEYYEIMYVLDNVDSWDGGRAIVGIDLLEGGVRYSFWGTLDDVLVLG